MLPPIVGAALGAPMWTIVALLLLRSQGGVAKAAAFAAGVMTVRLLQGILFSYLFVPADSAGGKAIDARFLSLGLLGQLGLHQHRCVRTPVIRYMFVHFVRHDVDVMSADYICQRIQILGRGCGAGRIVRTIE